MPRNNARSFLLLLSTNVVTKACWALILLLLLRRLGAASFGVLATLWSGATIAAGFSDFGTGQVVLREGSRDHGMARKLATQSVRAQAALTVALIFLLASGFWLVLPTQSLHGTQRTLVIVLGVATPLIDRFQTLFTVCSQIGGNYSTYSGIRSSYFVVLLLVITWALWHGGGVVSVSWIYFVLTTLFAALMGTRTWTLLPTTNVSGTDSTMRSLLLQGVPFLLVMTLTLAYGRVEVTILGLFGLSAIAGSYHVIYQLVLVVYSIVGMFFTVAYPRLYRHRGNSNALIADFRDTVRWLSLLAWLTAPPLWLFAEPILHLMGGAPLAAYAPLVRVLAVMLLIIPASAALNFLLPADMLRTRVACDIVGVGTTASIAAWAAIHDQPILVAVGAVLGYAAAVALAHWTLRDKLAGMTRILAEEVAMVGLRVVPAAGVAWAMPGLWWLRFVVFVAISALLLLTHRQIARRLQNWVVHPN